jgi:four helix bundle protein
MNFAFKDLHVWQRAVDFADTAIGIVDDLNTDRKHYRLIEQLESSVASISQNIAEGKGRNSKKEYIQFLYIARGSIYESVTLLNIFEKRKWITKNKLEELEKEAMEITNMIKGLINSVSKSSN